MGVGIDWKRFSERVPAGTQVRRPNDFIQVGAYNNEGILLENKPNDALDSAAAYRARDIEQGQESGGDDYGGFEDLLVQHFVGSWLYGPIGAEPVNPVFIEYLINDVWRSFSEVMTDEE